MPSPLWSDTHPDAERVLDQDDMQSLAQDTGLDELLWQAITDASVG